MNETDDRIEKLTLSQRTLLALKEARSRIEELERAKTEPIAITGMSCRFPGSNGLEGYWKALREGRNAVTEVPPERWDADKYYDPHPNAPGKVNTRYGGFIEDIDKFDADFFEMSALEASTVDPQQRLLLEVTKEALDDAGLPTQKLVGSNTGVFMGLALSEYAFLNMSVPEQANCYSATGSFPALVANRVSYTFDFRGPSFTVDAVCSASLLAVHLACNSLRNGECTTALAGGAGLLLRPEGLVWFAKLGVLCPDGRCKAFDHRGNGIVLGEGVGVIVLKPLSRALADGDSIYAVIRGSALAQDGRSNGIVAPSGPAQEAMLREAYRNARVDPAQVQYVEAHGTGTILGDPIEAKALGVVLGQGRPPERPCYLGSVKTNLGHLQMVGGVAGLIKVALAMKHRELPASIHFEKPNPHIPFEQLGLKVQDSLTPWPYEETAFAGVTSLSFGGTNVHVVMQEAPPPPQLEEGPALPLLLPLSARSDAALQALAASYQQFVAGHEEAKSLEAMAWTAAHRRDHYEHRQAVVFSSRESLLQELALSGDGQPRVNVVRGKARETPRKIAFVFSGQGSQWLGMGTRLLGQEPLFREAMERCDAALLPYTGWSVLQELGRDAGSSRMSSLEVIQVAIFSVQVSLAELWRSWGIQPSAVVGHSMGEVAAVHVSGALGLSDAARVIVRRSQLIQRIDGRGAMALVGMPVQETQKMVDGLGRRLSIAAVNGPSSTVVSGDPDAVDEVMRMLEDSNVFHSRVKSNAAGHSPHMDPLLEELIAALDGIQPQATSIPFFSTVTGGVLPGEALKPQYWTRNMREPVLFWPTACALMESGHDAFLEVSPHPILLASIEAGMRGSQRDLLLLSSWRQNEVEREVMLRSMGALFAAGHPIDWAALYPRRQRCVRLPRYPWQRRRYWLDIGQEAGLSPVQEAPQQNAPPASGNGRPAVKRQTEVITRLQEAHPSQRNALLATEIKLAVTKVLGREPPGLDRQDLGFFQLGMTSLQALEMKNHLEQTLGRLLPATLAFENPTMGQMIRHLLDVELQLPPPGEAPPPAPAPPPERAPSAAPPERPRDLTVMSDRELGSMLDGELAAIEQILD